jgi:deazaflavin-dependent oxidoreductase (nitroreductase family)
VASLAAATDVREDVRMTGFRKQLFRTGLKLMSGLHRLIYRASGGRAAGKVWNMSVLLLTTTGRKTGSPRTTPLSYFADGDDLVVVASNGGMDWFPDWWLNLMSEPRASVRLGRSTRAVVAREASPEERERLWATLTAIAPGYLEYQKRTRREIPLGILQPAQ